MPTLDYNSESRKEARRLGTEAARAREAAAAAERQLELAARQIASLQNRATVGPRVRALEAHGWLWAGWKVEQAWAEVREGQQALRALRFWAMPASPSLSGCS